MIKFKVNTKEFLLLFQGEVGPIGPPGPIGETGHGLPGPKVDLRNSNMRHILC